MNQIFPNLHFFYFQPLHKTLETSQMTNRLISSVGLLRRPFIRLSALNCPICSFCLQRAANSTNSITPVSRVLDRRPCSPPRLLSPPRRGCEAERVPSRAVVGHEAWTPRPFVSLQCRKALALRSEEPDRRCAHRIQPRANVRTDLGDQPSRIVTGYYI